MKKCFFLVLALCISLMPLAGCSGSPAQSSEPASSAVQEATVTLEPTTVAPTPTTTPTSTPAPTPTPKKTLSLGITLSDLPSILEGESSRFEFTTCTTDSFTASKLGSTYSNGIICFTKPDEDALLSILLLRYSESVNPTSYLREQGNKLVTYFENCGVDMRTTEWVDEENHVNVFCVSAKDSEFDDEELSSMLCELENKTGTPTPESTPVSETTPESIDNGVASGIVYWTSGGEKYHSTSECASLKRSKNIKHGTISQAGNREPCNLCH